MSGNTKPAGDPHEAGKPTRSLERPAVGWLEQLLKANMVLTATVEGTATGDILVEINAGCGAVARNLAFGVGPTVEEAAASALDSFDWTASRQGP